LIIAALASLDAGRVCGERVWGCISIRLTDYDSPELFSSKCPKEHALAWQARRELQALLTLAEAGSLKMSFKLAPCAYSNYGRLCAQASIDGKPLADHMIKLGFASSYVCEPGYCPAKRNWCNPAPDELRRP
jgi:hypothetical protein